MKPHVPATISVQQAGEILGVSRRTAYRAADRGQIPVIRIGRRWFVPTARLLDLLGLTAEEIDFDGESHRAGHGDRIVNTPVTRISPLSDERRG